MKKIVQGNDFRMRIPVFRIFNGEQVPFPLPASEQIQVRLCGEYRRIELEYEIDVTNDNVLVAKVDGRSISCGCYALEVKGVMFGQDWRSCEYEQIRIVHNNAEADTEFDYSEGEPSVEMDTALAILAADPDFYTKVEQAEQARVAAEQERNATFKHFIEVSQEAVEGAEDVVALMQGEIQMRDNDFKIKGKTGTVKFNKTTAAITYDVENTDSGGDVYDTTTKISPVELSTTITASNGKSTSFKVGSDSIKAGSSAGMTFEPEGTFKVSAGAIEMRSAGSIKVHAEKALNFKHDSGSSFNVSVDNSHGSENTLKLKKDGFDLQVYDDEDELTTRIQVSNSALRFKGKGDINIDDEKRLYINAADGDAIRITGFGEYDATGVTYKEIHPNIHYRFGEVDELEVVLAEPSTGNYKKEYSFEFTALSNSSDIKLPSGVWWETPLEIKERTLYQIKILNNIGTINSCYIPTMEERYMYFYSNTNDFTVGCNTSLDYLLEGESTGWVSGKTFLVPAKTKVYVKNNIRNSVKSLHGSDWYNIGGNIRSLHLGDGAYDAPPYKYESYMEWFAEEYTLVSASDLHWGCDSIGFSACWRMFYNCIQLLHAPKRLHSILLDEECYDEMFKGCYHLLTAPELPATKLTKNCYRRMFEGCGDITVAPELPATELADYCYYEMFRACVELTYVKAMFKTLPSNYCTYLWMAEIRTSGTFVKAEDATWDEVGPSGVPEGWTILTE